MWKIKKNGYFILNNFEKLIKKKLNNLINRFIKIEDDVFVNPQPPANYSHPTQSKQENDHLTNEDFRRLLMTPSVSSSSIREKTTQSTSKLEINSSK